MPSLFTNNTFFTFQSVDTSTATVTPQEGGGYEYVNDVSILGADGVTPTTANVRLICEPNGNCISMTVDGAFLFYAARNPQECREARQALPAGLLCV